MNKKPKKSNKNGEMSPLGGVSGSFDFLMHLYENQEVLDSEKVEGYAPHLQRYVEGMPIPRVGEHIFLDASDMYEVKFVLHDYLYTNASIKNPMGKVSTYKCFENGDIKVIAVKCDPHPF